SYWRSSCSYRVRIALGLKGLTWDTAPIHLVEGGQKSETYGALNPSHLVPTLELADGTVLTQSLAIIDWLDATHPEPSFVPSDPLERTRVLAASHIIAMDVQPVTNSGTVAHLKSAHGASQDAGIAWMVHWMEKGFAAYQATIAEGTPFSFGDAPSLADICLVPQLYNAHRWGVDLTPFARLTEIEARCLALPAFDAARPENQPDAE
ncbi:MAG: maleylacetoacetate isomerase, partial [Pseudomonadota bacterium]